MLTGSGQLQKLVNTAAGASTATNITKAQIMNVFAQASAADAEIKRSKIKIWQSGILSSLWEKTTESAKPGPGRFNVSNYTG